MTRENRIKEIVFPAISVTGSVLAPTICSNVINGEILKIRFENMASPGSLWFVESGLTTEVYRKNDFTSGTNEVEVYPFTYLVDNKNTTGSPYAFAPRVINDYLVLAGSGLTSGTGVTIGPIKVFYR